jgi:hypothetical protein
MGKPALEFLDGQLVAAVTRAGDMPTRSGHLSSRYYPPKITALTVGLCDKL